VEAIAIDEEEEATKHSLIFQLLGTGRGNESIRSIGIYAKKI
jgi:hypothetical protein